MEIDGVQRSLPVASIGEPRAFRTEGLPGRPRKLDLDGAAGRGMFTARPVTDKGYR